MGGPCEVLAEDADEAAARKIVDVVATCAWRIEDKFSRYRPDNIVARINTSAGEPVEVDDETANLLDFAALVHRLSDGMFDITSGVLRRAWTFDGGDRMPPRIEIEALLPLVGWSKVQWTRPVITLRPGMQIDFGGIGKEYAVDQATQLAAQTSERCGARQLWRRSRHHPRPPRQSAMARGHRGYRCWCPTRGQARGPGGRER